MCWKIAKKLEHLSHLFKIIRDRPMDTKTLHELLMEPNSSVPCKQEAKNRTEIHPAENVWSELAAEKRSEWGHDFLLCPRIIIYLVIVTTEPAIDCWLWCVSSGLAWGRYDKSHSGQCLPHTLPLPWPDIGVCRSIMTNHYCPTITHRNIQSTAQ